ncbi:hypothetical protein AB8O64_06435 [Streptomyces sp. QH1-20]|uniref:hypothetical protein n=1 Tax=Streptomyces sp. QH1-20 TaxID=3240934 RepID=UPI003519BEBD
MSVRITALTDPEETSAGRRLVRLAGTADNIPYMRHVNDQLGYLPTHTSHEYQLVL